jgi:16S rRNA (uracil1498-N3)-methyltransferase
LTAETGLRLDEAASRHLARVLRLASGHPVVLFDGEGRRADARIDTVSRGQVAVRVEAVSAPAPEPALKVTLAQGIARGERMDYALQKAVELGVHRLVPLATERSVVQLRGERLARRTAHWRAVVVASCEQSQWPHLPRLEPLRDLGAWLAEAAGPGILLDPTAEATLPDLPPPAGTLNLLVGPEGGLSAREVTLATQAGFRRVRLGPRVLRTETAPLAALAAVQALWGDFRA